MNVSIVFDIGVWNAWIFTLALYAAAFVPMLVNSDNAEKRMEGEPTGSDQHRIMRIATIITHGVIMPLTLIYSIFLPIQSGTWWFYGGISLYLIGLFMVLTSSISFAFAPIGEPMSTGVYAISRHPMYFGFFLAFTGIGICCASVLFLLFALLWIVSWHFAVPEEERVMLQKYGDAYERYLAQTPRWIGIPRGKNHQGLKPLC